MAILIVKAGCKNGRLAITMVIGMVMMVVTIMVIIMVDMVYIVNNGSQFKKMIVIPVGNDNS